MGIDYEAEIESFEWDIPDSYAITSVIDELPKTSSGKISRTEFCDQEAEKHGA